MTHDASSHQEFFFGRFSAPFCRAAFFNFEEFASYLRSSLFVSDFSSVGQGSFQKYYVLGHALNRLADLMLDAIFLQSVALLLLVIVQADASAVSSSQMSYPHGKYS
jgi:hypothetical protein